MLTAGLKNMQLL